MQNWFMHCEDVESNTLASFFGPPSIYLFDEKDKAFGGRKSLTCNSNSRRSKWFISVIFADELPDVFHKVHINCRLVSIFTMLRLAVYFLW